MLSSEKQCNMKIPGMTYSINLQISFTKIVKCLKKPEGSQKMNECRKQLITSIIG